MEGLTGLRSTCSSFTSWLVFSSSNSLCAMLEPEEATVAYELEEFCESSSHSSCLPPSPWVAMAPSWPKRERS
eukprot:344817-Hanusia_phi.AAC.2